MTSPPASSPGDKPGNKLLPSPAMEVYGLTGGIGSGKSTVAEMLEEYGIPVVSADELSRMVVSPGSRGLADVVEAFGPEVLDDKGELDRKKMGQIVFTTPERRRQLESILHPRIRERYEQVLDALEKAGHKVMIYEVPLLFEKNLDQQDEFKGVILVTATTDTRIARVKARDALTTDDVLARMRAQMPEQEKRQRADYVIHNDGDLDDLRREVEHLISRFLRLPPRATEEDIEAEPELIDDSEIDTLSPEEVEETPTEEIDLDEPEGAVSPAAAEPAPESLAIEVVGEQPRAPEAPTMVAELEVELAPAPLTATPAAGPPTFSPPFIPTTPTPVPTTPQVAPPPQVSPPPQVAAPPQVGPPPQVAPPPQVPSPPQVPAPPATSPRPPRPRVGTVPQMNVPQLSSPPRVGEPASGDGEESPT